MGVGARARLVSLPTASRCFRYRFREVYQQTVSALRATFQRRLGRCRSRHRCLAALEFGVSGLATQDCYSRKAKMGRELMAPRTDCTTCIPCGVASPVITNHAAQGSVFVNARNFGNLNIGSARNFAAQTLEMALLTQASILGRFGVWGLRFGVEDSVLRVKVADLKFRVGNGGFRI